VLLVDKIPLVSVKSNIHVAHYIHLADPLVRKWIGKVPNSVLLEAPVGSRSEWKLNSTHIYRVNPDISLKAIPTLIRWTKVRYG
jgi:hypothetical protein